MVLHDYACMAHGTFESSEESPKCPKGCNTVQRVYLQAPATIGQRTRNKDAIQRDIASRFGLTDMSNKDGTSVASNIKKEAKSFALAPTRTATKEQRESGQKPSLDLSGVIAGSGAFEYNAPGGIQKADTGFQEARQAVAGSRVRNTEIAAACDKDGNVISRGHKMDQKTAAG